MKALSVVPKEGWAQIVAFAGFLELVVNKKTSEPGAIHAFRCTRLGVVCLLASWHFLKAIMERATSVLA